MNKIHLSIICIVFSQSIPNTFAQTKGKVNFKSSNSSLNEAFQWAKKEALSYAHSKDPVGAWYEAALPGRNAFCMRDVSHQSLGAAMLGLNDHNINMFHKFAINISESKDYCSYWEINKFNKPAPVDYKNDDDFWYNLPANFDVVYNCYRQYLWTGDSIYLNHPDFINFYEKSLNEYVERWDLSYDKVTLRNRLINLKNPKDPSKSFFYSKRGIPSYNEGGKGETLLGLDMTASLIAAYEAYAQILQLKGEKDKAITYKNRVDLEKKFLDNFWWDKEKKEYKSILYDDHSFDYFMVGDNQAFTHYLLYFNALDNKSRIQSIISKYVDNHESLIVELKSYLPVLFYENGNSEIATNMIINLCSENNKRRSYPENSFTVIESIVRGLMGIEAYSPGNEVATISRLPSGLKWAEIRNLPILSGEINVRHERNLKSSFTNLSERKIRWKACFNGELSNLYLDGKLSKEAPVFDGLNTYLILEVLPGETKSVSMVNE